MTTSARSLQGPIKWLTRADWRDRFAEVYDHHQLAGEPGLILKRSWQSSAKISS
jgi:hypothetical protein